MHHSRSCSFDPGIFHEDDPIAHSRDEIHEECIFSRFGQPYRITNFAFETTLSQISESLLRGFCGHEEIEILCKTADARVLPQCDRAGDRVRHVLCLEDGENFLEQRRLFLWNLRRHRRSHRQRFLRVRLFWHEAWMCFVCSRLLLNGLEAIHFPAWLTLQMEFEASSLTSSEPSGATVIPTGRPQTCPSGSTNPVRKSWYSPVALPLWCKGMRMTS